MRILVRHLFIKFILKAKILKVGELSSLPSRWLLSNMFFTESAFQLISSESIPQAKNNPSISIVVIHHNPSRLSWLIDCISSLQAQTYKKFEIILVINYDMTDDIRNFVSKFNNIKVLPFENSHPSQARNFGMQNCEGTLILFVDDDNLLLPWHVIFIVNAYHTNPNAAIYFGSYLSFRNEKVINFPLRYLVTRETILLGDPTDVSSMAIQKSYFPTIKWDDQVLSENWAILVDAFERDLPVHQISTPLSLHREHSESRSSTIERPLIPKLWFEKYRNEVNLSFKIPDSKIRVKFLKIFHSYHSTIDL